MGLLKWLLGSDDEDPEQEYYSDLHELYCGERPDHKLSEVEMMMLEALEEDEWDED